MKRKLYIVLFLVISYFVYPRYVYSASLYREDDIKTDSIALINMDTDSVVFEKNADKRRSIASVTKVMTYIIVAENIVDMETEKVSVPEEVLKSLEGTESSLSGLRSGDVLSVKDLLHCLMIKSGNDAAAVLADYVGKGSIDSFVSMMNDKASKLGCRDTCFFNPHGLDTEKNYSTSLDICKISKHALGLPGFYDMVNKTEYDVFKDGRPLLRTTNKMIDSLRGGEFYYPYANGIKTGWFTEAGCCLVSTATKDGCTYMCAALGGPKIDENGNTTNYAMIDSKKIYTWAFNELGIRTVTDINKPMSEVNLGLAWRKDKLLLCPQDNFRAVIPKVAKISDIEVNCDVPYSIDAPIEKGDVIGSAIIKYDGELIGRINLVSQETIPRSNVLFILKLIETMVNSKLFIIILFLVIIFSFIYIFIMLKQNIRKQKRVKVRRKRKKSFKGNPIDKFSS